MACSGGKEWKSGEGGGPRARETWRVETRVRQESLARRARRALIDCPPIARSVLPAPLPLRRQQHRLSGCAAAALEHSLHAKVANDTAILVLGVGELKIRLRAGHDLARYNSQVDRVLAHDGLFADVEGAREVILAHDSLLALGKLAEEATDDEVCRLVWHDRLPADDRRHALADARLRELERLAAVEDDQPNLAPGQKLCHLVVVHLRRRDLALRVGETEPLLAARAGHIGVA
mmetsp:Transcript_26565/g.79392  ORF Transcript_26565/g.79392 Transcript_26565/m.79392 type:complete len:234 (-) Transcript_26565:997-1698(-)